MLLPIPLFCFSATLVTDLVYWQTAAMQWANISAWLLLVGLVASILVVFTDVAAFVGNRHIFELRAWRVHALGNCAALALSAINTLVHTRDAYTSVVPAGLLLSALVVLVLVVTACSGWAFVYRHGVAVHAKTT